MELGLLATDRHHRGREHTAAVLNWWLGRNDLTHVQARALAAWVCGDETWLQGSQLSHLRNGRMRAPQLKLFEGLAGLNAALACWVQEGKVAALKNWGPPPGEIPPDSVLDAAVFLWHPSDEQQPLVFHDFCDLFVGYMELPYAAAQSVSPGQSRLISERISEAINRWITSHGGAKAGLAAVIQAYPVEDMSRVLRLQAVALGADTYSAAELDQELLALSELFTQLWGRPYSPSQLLAALVQDPLPFG